MIDSKYKVIVCNNLFKRLMGFMFKRNINVILCFPKCSAIHTFFMFNSIDVIMTDKDKKILYIFNNVKPWKVIWPKKGVYYTYELPINVSDFKVNDYLK